MENGVKRENGAHQWEKRKNAEEGEEREAKAQNPKARNEEHATSSKDRQRRSNLIIRHRKRVGNVYRVSCIVCCELCCVVL